MFRMSRALSPVAFILSILALVVVTTAGTAYATILIGTKNIKSGAVTSAKIKDGTIQRVDVRNGTLTGGKVADGSLGLSDLSASTRTSLRVRAFATVNPDANISHDPALLPGRTRGFTGVTRTAPGDYCLSLNPALGINPAKVSVLVSGEYGFSGGNELQPYFYADATCPAGQIHIYTEQLGLPSNNVAFSVILP